MKRACLLIAFVALAGCRQDMAEQAKYTPLSPSHLWPDGASARPLVAGTVSRGALDAAAALATPPPMSAALVARGRERYDIFCAPCHGPTGEGDGRVVQRGFPAPPSYLIPRLRAASAQHFVDVITNGYGVMFSYAARVPPHDRWAIAAYIRALQLAGTGGKEPAP